MAHTGLAVGVARLLRRGRARAQCQRRARPARGRYWAIRYPGADADALVARVQVLHRALRARYGETALTDSVPMETDGWTAWFAAADAAYQRFHGGRVGTKAEDADFDALFGAGPPPVDVAGAAWARVAARVERVMEGYVLAAAAEAGLLEPDRMLWWVPALAGVLAACRQRWGAGSSLRCVLGAGTGRGPGLVQLCWEDGCTWPVAVSRRWPVLLAAGLALPGSRLLVTAAGHARRRLDGIVVWRAVGLHWPPGGVPRAWMGFAARHPEGACAAGGTVVDAVRDLHHALWSSS